MPRQTLSRVGALLGSVSGFLTRRLRNQIVVPYLALATVFAIAGTYLLLNSANQSLQSRFNNQLLDAARGAADALTKAESDQLAGLRALSFTQGFPEALAAQNVSSLRSLAGPQALNYGFDHLLIVGNNGLLLSFPDQNPTPSSPASPPAGLTALINSALHPAGDQDKVSAIMSVNSNPVFYTAGPVMRGSNVVGAVLVGTDLTRLLHQVARSSLSDAVGFYTGDNASAYALTSSDAAPSVPPLPGGWYTQILSNTQQQVRLRTLTLSGSASGTYVEALGQVPGRGIGGGPVGVYGVMLNTGTLSTKLNDTLWELVPLFAVGLLFIILTGHLIASGIHRPITELVDASNQVAHGDLNVQVATERKDELGTLATGFNVMVSGLRESLMVKDLFGRFVSPEVSAKLLAGEIELGGEQREVTVLFSDLRDFTTLSERYPAHAIVDLLNEYLGYVIEAAQENGGIINKFGGDSTMIIFGAPVDMPDHADRALSTALAMQAGLDKVNAHRAREGWPALRQGVGINSGIVVAGQIGSYLRMEYTVIGDAVNLASRLQAMTKDIEGCDIIFSESTLTALSEPSEWLIKGLGPIKVRGKQRPVRVYSLLGSTTHERTRVRDVEFGMLNDYESQVMPRPQFGVSSSRRRAGKIVAKTNSNTGAVVARAERTR